MKNYILFYAHGYNGEERHKESAFQGFENTVERIEMPTGQNKRIGPHAWLLDRDNDASIFAAIVVAADGALLKYDVLYLSSD